MSCASWTSPSCCVRRGACWADRRRLGPAHGRSPRRPTHRGAERDYHPQRWRRAMQVRTAGSGGAAQQAPRRRRLQWSKTGPRMSTRAEDSAASLNRPRRYLAGSADRWVVLPVPSPQSIQPGRCVPILASAASMNASSDRCDRSMSRSSPRRVSPSASSLPDAKVSSASQPSPVAKSTLALFAA